MKRNRPFPKVLAGSLLCGILLVSPGCSSGGGGGGQPDSAALPFYLPELYSTFETVMVHIGYEPGAEPFAGYTQDAFHFQYWSVLETNLHALFQGRDIEPDVIVPTELSGMEEIPEQDRDSWTLSQIANLANDTWHIPLSADTAHFFVLFLNGFYHDGDAVQDDVGGISFTLSPLIVIFKDNFASWEHVSSFDKAITEQAILVHEFGHGMGLTNNGLPMVSNHEDPGYEDHCDNPSCVMYWSTNRVSHSMFAQKIIDTHSVMMFCDECLNDARSYEPGGITAAAAQEVVVFREDM